MAYDGNIEKQGMSTKTKWLIGCGGCLGVLLIIAVVLSVLAGMGLNKLKGVSDQSVQNVFGPSFKPAPYMAFGLPLAQKDLKNMVMMIDKGRGVIVFAVETEVAEGEARILKSGDPKQIEALLKRISDRVNSSSSSGSSRMKDVRFDEVNTTKLQNGKVFPFSKATIETERRGGTVTYSPAVAALVPESGNRLVALIALNPNNASTSPDTNFSSPQAELQAEIVRIINESELDDRLTSTAPIKPKTAAP